MLIFWPVCVLRWDFNTPDDTKALPHWWHVYGFSPVWERSCCFRWLDFLKPLLHQEHLWQRNSTHFYIKEQIRLNTDVFYRINVNLHSAKTTLIHGLQETADINIEENGFTEVLETTLITLHMVLSRCTETNKIHLNRRKLLVMVFWYFTFPLICQLFVTIFLIMIIIMIYD